jgi:predicted NUDIX family NTP pyrophosphohydrolase
MAMSQTSAGLLLFRRTSGLEVFLAHPGGPFWKNKEDGAWSIPKGVIEEGEEPLEAACREFQEETGIMPAGPFLNLGSIRQKSGKIIYAWAWEGAADPATVRSNTISIEFPPKSKRFITVPEVDRCAWFRPEEAKHKINAAQAELIDRLQEHLG